MPTNERSRSPQYLKAVLAHTIKRLGFFQCPSDVIEIRALRVPGKGTVTGYFNNAEKLVNAAVELDLRNSVSAVYVTLNEVRPECLHRAVNRLKFRADNGETTSDKDIECRRLLLIDFDPKRPSGISSTDAEHEMALSQARACQEWLTDVGWPAPFLCDSGNGAHLLYRIDLPNDEEARDLLRRVLLAVSDKWDSSTLDVDKKVFNASRITKLYGTMSRKGDHTTERPHRESAILEGPERLELVSKALLQALAAHHDTVADSKQAARPMSQKTQSKQTTATPKPPHLNARTGLGAAIEAFNDEDRVLAFFEQFGVSDLKESGAGEWHKGVLDHPSHQGGSGSPGFSVSAGLKTWHDFRSGKSGGMVAFLETYRGMSHREAGREVARFLGLDVQMTESHPLEGERSVRGCEPDPTTNIALETDDLGELGWEEDIPNPVAEYCLPDGETGQWEPEQDADARAAVDSVKRPTFDRTAERQAIEDGDSFYAASDELRDAKEVILSLGSPAELGMRAILDRVKGSGVPRDHGTLTAVKVALKAEHVVYADGQLCLYLRDRGYWKMRPLEDIENNIQAYDGSPYGTPKKNGEHPKKTLGDAEIHSALKCGLRHVTRSEFFHQRNVVPGLVMRNYFWTVRDGRIDAIPHSPWHRARWGYDFDPPAFAETLDDAAYRIFVDRSPLDAWWADVCPVWHWLISSCLPGRHDDVRFLQELVIASLTGQATQYQKGAILLGGGGNGKGTLIKAITLLFPSGTISSTNPGRWREVYDRTPLIGKLLNVLTETQAWKHMDALKAVMTGDPIEARFMGMNAFIYEPIAGHIFSCNKLPPEVDEAMLSRWEVIEFKQKFRGSDSQVSEDQILVRLRQELPGFLLWAMHGWFRLTENGRMTRPEKSQALKAGWQEDGSTVLLFLAKACRKNPMTCVSRSSLFKAYQGWCAELGFPPQRIVDANDFKKTINLAGFPDDRKGKNRDRVYMGLEPLASIDREL